jgi:predicted kinase
MDNQYNRELIVLRGSAGSGKSTFAELLGGVICCADDYFMIDGEYKFDATKLRQAHDSCRHKFEHAVFTGAPRVVIANTNTQAWEFEPYKAFAESHGYRVFVIVVENRHGGTNVHGVPDEILAKQKARFEIKL